MFRDDYLKYINSSISRAITQIIQNSLNRPLILDIIDINVGVRVMVLNATFNNISIISWRSILLVEVPEENHRPVASKLYHITLYRVHLV